MLTVDATWHELKQVTRRFNYGGPTTRIKIIRLNRILDFEIYSNGVQIEKDAGANLFLETSADTEPFGLLLGRAIRDQMQA